MRLLLVCFAALASVAPSGPAQAGDPAHCPPPLLPPPARFELRTVTKYRTEYRTKFREVQRTVTRKVPQTVMKEVQETVMVPYWRDEARQRTVMVPTTRLETRSREVLRTEWEQRQ